MTVWIFLALVFGFALGVLAGRFTKRAKTTPAPPKPKDEHTYGHPWPPVPALREKLPPAPQGHAWETKVETDDRGHSILTLTLVQVFDGKNIASRTCDLTRDTYFTWSRQYREYASIRKEIFHNQLLGPVVDWATIAANKVSTKGQTTDYSIG